LGGGGGAGWLISAYSSSNSCWSDSNITTPSGSQSEIVPRK
jgi:hypothetical protein